MCKTRDPLVSGLSPVVEEVQDIQGNLFAAMTLLPQDDFIMEMRRVDISVDMISQMAKAFNVSRGLICHCMTHFIENREFSREKSDASMESSL